jgi:hypothetical protein
MPEITRSDAFKLAQPADWKPSRDEHVYLRPGKYSVKRARLEAVLDLGLARVRLLTEASDSFGDTGSYNVGRSIQVLLADLRPITIIAEKVAKPAKPKPAPPVEPATAGPATAETTPPAALPAAQPAAPSIPHDKPPPVGKNHPQTSHAAAKAVSVRAGTQRWRVLELLWKHTEHGLIDEEMQTLLNMKASSQGTRRKELQDDGWLKDSGQTRKTSTGCEAIIWLPVKPLPTST